ncbi:hypothetical protein BDV93DRAFT_406430, partial [Ceratobasidium sp. AG-I]
GHRLDADNMQTMQGLNFKVDANISAKAFGKLPQAFPELDSIPSIYRTCAWIASLSGLQAMHVDCCVDSCIAFTGPYKCLKECVYCGQARYKADPWNPRRQQAHWTFQYLPLVPRLTRMYLDSEMSCKLAYRATRWSCADTISDIFDGAHYKNLLGERVTVSGTHLLHNFFSQPTDIALGLSTDGFGPFKSQKQIC